MNFPSSRRKVERAMKHVHDLNELLVAFSQSDFYTVSVEDHEGSNNVRIDIDNSGFSAIDAALIIGDALHNLKSALDILYYQIMHESTGVTDHRTRFPIRNERKELVDSINGGLKQKSLADDPSALAIRDVIVDVIQAYQAGNYPLWALHELNILDKHQLIIPVFNLMRITDIRLEDDKKQVFLADGQPFYMDHSYRSKLNREGAITVKDKGRASTGIAFEAGIPFQGELIIPQLNKIAESVTRTIDTFEAVFKPLLG
jgi:hypothetical protein